MTNTVLLAMEYQGMSVGYANALMQVRSMCVAKQTVSMVGFVTVL